MTHRRSRRRVALAFGVGAVLSVLLAACGGSSPSGEQVAGVRPSVTLAAPEDRPTAPLDAVGRLVGSDEQVALRDWLGDVVVVNFWGSWCGPCRAEQPELNRAHDVLDDRPVSWLGVNVDDTEVNARAHEDEFSMPYPSVFDPDAAYAAAFGGIGARAIPTTLVLDAEGRVAFRFFSEVSGDEVIAAVERLLTEPT